MESKLCEGDLCGIDGKATSSYVCLCGRENYFLLIKILKCAIDLMQVLPIVLFPSHMLLNNDSNSHIFKSEEYF